MLRPQSSAPIFAAPLQFHVSALMKIEPLRRFMCKFVLCATECCGICPENRPFRRRVKRQPTKLAATVESSIIYRISPINRVCSESCYEVVRTICLEAALLR